MNPLKVTKDPKAEWRKFLASLAVQLAIGAGLLLLAWFGP